MSRLLCDAISGLLTAMELEEAQESGLLRTDQAATKRIREKARDNARQALRLAADSYEDHTPPGAYERAAVADWMTAAIRGEPVDDFGQSFPEVREAMDLRAGREAAIAAEREACAAIADAQAEAAREAWSEAENQEHRFRADGQESAALEIATDIRERGEARCP